MSSTPRQHLRAGSQNTIITHALILINPTHTSIDRGSLSKVHVSGCVIDLGKPPGCDGTRGDPKRGRETSFNHNPCNFSDPNLSHFNHHRRMAIIARYQRYLSPSQSPSSHRPSQTSDLAELLPSNAHLRAPLPRTDSDNRRQELAKQLAKDEEPVSTRSEGRDDTNYLLAKAVVGRYMEPYLPTIREHKVVLERGVEVVEDSLRKYRGRKGAVDSALSSLGRGIEVEWVILLRMAPPAVALYVWWVLLAIWRKLDDGKHDFLVHAVDRDEVKTWLTWAFAGLAVVLCALAFVVWAVVGMMRMFSSFRLDPLPIECNKSRD